MDTVTGWLRRKRLALLLTILLATGAAYWGANGAGVDAAKTIFGYAGSGRDGIAVNLFLPDKLFIEQGDTVEWVNPYEEPHTITYLIGDASYGFEEVANVASTQAFNGTQPFSSGFIVKDAHFSVTFEKLGTYTFLCLLHPGMTVEVNVQPVGTMVPPQGANSPQNTNRIEFAIGLAKQAIAKLAVPPPATNEDGTKNYTILTGPGTPLPQGSSVDVMKFYAPDVQIAVGDTVTWKDETFVPHTVTFIPQDNLPDAIDPFVPDVSSTEYDGSTYVNSGILSAVPEFGNVTSFSLTFTKAGTYQYICLLHADQGMVGQIVVGTGASVTPPSTGDGGLIE